MCAGVARVAVGAAEGYRHAAVSARREDEHQLLQIGTMVLGETVDDRRCGPVPDLPADRGAVVSTETNGGAVIVKLVESQVEALTDCDHHLGEQRRPISVKQPIQSASEPIVAEVLHLLGRDAEHPAGEDLNRLLLPIDRLSFDNNRAQQHTQRTAVGDGAPGVGANVPIDQIFQAKALDEMIDDRQGTQALALQGAAGHFACFQANQSLRVVIVGRRESSAVSHPSPRSMSPESI